MLVRCQSVASLGNLMVLTQHFRFASMMSMPSAKSVSCTSERMSSRARLVQLSSSACAVRCPMLTERVRMSDGHSSHFAG